MSPERIELIRQRLAVAGLDLFLVHKRAEEIVDLDLDAIANRAMTALGAITQLLALEEEGK